MLCVSVCVCVCVCVCVYTCICVSVCGDKHIHTHTHTHSHTHTRCVDTARKHRSHLHIADEEQSRKQGRKSTKNSTNVVDVFGEDCRRLRTHEAGTVQTTLLTENGWRFQFRFIFLWGISLFLFLILFRRLCLSLLFFVYILSGSRAAAHA